MYPYTGTVDSVVFIPLKFVYPPVSVNITTEEVQGIIGLLLPGRINAVEKDFFTFYIKFVAPNGNCWVGA